jgi:hypothetical protein
MLPDSPQQKFVVDIVEQTLDVELYPIIFPAPPMRDAESKNRLEAENAVLRHQLIVLHRKVRGRVQFTNSDRLLHPAVSWATSEPTSLRVRQPLDHVLS